MNVLVINCGSSSLKYQLINSDTEAVLAKGLFARELVLTEDLHIRKQVLTKRLQRLQCLHIKRLSSLYLTLL